jgi:hypothetical protein
VKNTEEVFAHIANKHNITPAEVEFEMERAIEEMWRCGKLKSFKQKPTIREFLRFAVAEVLR